MTNETEPGITASSTEAEGSAASSPANVDPAQTTSQAAEETSTEAQRAEVDLAAGGETSRDQPETERTSDATPPTENATKAAEPATGTSASAPAAAETAHLSGRSSPPTHGSDEDDAPLRAAGPASASGLVIPGECVPFIRLQRSRYAERKVPDAGVVRDRYIAHVEEDFNNIAPHLPKEVGSIIEIGCGVGALQPFLQRLYPKAAIGLLDGDGETAVGGYLANSAPYNSRKCTEALLKANGCKVDRWFDIGTKELLEADLIISLASWGYHYPLSTYRAKAPVCIVDLRRGNETRRGKVIFEGPKYDRCVFTLP